LYRLGVLISGRGSNFHSILKNIQTGFISNAEIVVVISNKADAKGLEIAKENGIDALFVDPKNIDRKKYDKLIAEKLIEYGVDFVILAGFMRILSDEFIETFKNRIVNIHPSLLPSFRGLHAQRQALEKGVKFSGATVHFVTNELDDGAIIVQSIVPILNNDTEETLSDRILKTEHTIYPLAVKLLTEDRLKLDGARVIHNADELQDGFYITNPTEL
jgi:phosphoribosylglycinamide formyltransferase-1